MENFLDFMTGSDSKLKPFNKQSMSKLMQMITGGGLENNETFGMGNDYLQSILGNDQGSFDTWAAPYKRQFEQETIPGIAERFAGMGTGAGAGNSSALYNALGQAGSNFSTGLAGMREGMKGQAAQQGLQYANQPIMNLLQALGMVPGQYYEKPGQQGLLQGGFNAFASSLGKF